MPTDFNRKKYISKVIYSKITIIILIIFAVFLVQNTLDMYKKARDIAFTENKANEQLNTIKNRNNYVQSEIDRLQTNQGLEYEIRSKFNVSKANEKVIIIVDEEATTTEPSQKSDNPIEEIKDFFKNLFH